MKKTIPFWILSIAASLILSTGLLAQEQVEVSIKVTKDGKVVKDTTYQFDDASEAKHAMKMMELMSGDDEHMEHITYDYTMSHAGSGHSKAMVFISEDGEKTEIKKLHADSLVWVSEDEVDGDHVKVMRYKIEEGDEPHGKKVIVMKNDDGDIVKKKEIKVMVSGDKEGNWTVVEGDDEVKVRVMEIIEEEGDGENVKVIVIKEGGDVHMDLHEDHDKDHDHDEDIDHDKEVEVKVVKKKEKK